tara:strand:+ start:406 stop:645 length:240 start_codon:yes stop_codon:yes gene_type:complete
MAIPKGEPKKQPKKSLLASKKQTRQKMASVENDLWGRATMLAEEFADSNGLDFDGDDLVQGYRMDKFREMMSDYRKTLK